MSDTICGSHAMPSGDSLETAQERKLRLLCVGSPTSATADLSRRLSAESRYEVQWREGFEEVIEALVHQTPRFLLLDPTTESFSPMELLSTLERLELRIPILLILDPAEELEETRGVPSFLGFAKADLDAQEMYDRLVDAVDRASRTRPGPLFRLVEHLQVAVLARLTVRLELSFQRGEALQVLVVDGDVWTAKRGSLEREAALRGSLFALPGEIEVSACSPPPLAERQMEEDGRRLLRRLLTRFRSPGPSVANKEVAFDLLFMAGLEAELASDLKLAQEAIERALCLRPNEPRALQSLERIRRRRAAH